MLDVKNLTDTMSRMPLPQLQQYAALHKNDPYIVTLALSIANQKKQMMLSKDGQAGMMPQPKVVDQDIAQMVAPSQPQMPPQQMPPQQMAAAPQQQALPEDQGIGQLPAQNMQGMAEGGIVGFAGGGDVPGFADGIYVGQGFNQIPLVPPPTANRNALIASKAAAIAEQERQEELRKVQEALQTTPSGQQKNYLENRQKILLGNQPSPAAPTAPNTAVPPVAYDPATATRRSMYVDKTAAPPTSSPAAPSVPPTTKLVNPTLPPSAGLTSLNNTAMTPAEAMAAGKQFGDESALTSGIDKLRSDALQTNRDVKSAYDQGISALPKPGEEAEARLKAREAQDAIGQADAKALAIFKAGLGMLAGTSQHAFENIGKGAMVGLEDYASSIKDFRKLAIERDKAYADIENARYAASRDDLKTSVGLQEKAADRLMRVDEKGIDITANIFKTNKETAANIYRDSFDQVQQNARTAATNATSLGIAQINERGANARAQMGSPLNLYAKLGAAEPDSALVKGYNIAKNETQMAHLFESYNKQANDMMVGPAFRAQFPTFGAYMQEYQKSLGVGNSGFTQPPPNTAVLKPK